MTFKDFLGYFSRKAQSPTNQIVVVDKQVTVTQLDRTRPDIRKWRNALESAESPYYPDRTELIELYEEFILDLTIESAIKKRVRRVRNTPVIVFNQQGEKDEAKTKLINATWFQEFVKYAVESEFWGFSLMELKVEKGSVMECVLIPRIMTHPEFAKVSTYTPYDKEGINFYEKPYVNYLIFSGENKDLGLLNKLAPYCIYKRATLVDWAEHSEVFGMPIRIYEYDPQQPNARREAEESARNMGSMAYVVVPKGTGLKLEGGDGTAKPDMYETFRQALNEEMTISILGQTMTTANGSSRSQAEVHERTEADIFADDLYRVQLFTNNQLVPRLVNFGILTEGDFVTFDKSEKLTIEQQLEMDLKLCEVMDVPQSYLYQKYNIPYPEKGELLAYRKNQQNNLPTTKPNALQDDQVFFLNNTPFVFDTVFKKYADDFLKALENGLEEDISPELLEALRQNAVEFAWAKTYVIEQAYSKGLTEGLAKVLEVAGYTQTEKDLFTASRQMAYKWERIQADKETLPLLQYDALNDSRTRPSHRALDGVTLPIDHDFWKTHYPPMGYNCRCTVKQLSTGKETTNDDLTERMAQEGGQPDQGFGYNAGIEKVAFRKDMSYFAELPENAMKQAAKQANEYLKK